MSMLIRAGHLLAAVGACFAAYYVASGNVDQFWTVVITLILLIDGFRYLLRVFYPDLPPA